MGAPQDLWLLRWAWEGESGRTGPLTARAVPRQVVRAPAAGLLGARWWCYTGIVEAQQESSLGNEGSGSTQLFPTLSRVKQPRRCIHGLKNYEVNYTFSTNLKTYVFLFLKIYFCLFSYFSLFFLFPSLPIFFLVRSLYNYLFKNHGEEIAAFPHIMNNFFLWHIFSNPLSNKFL